MKSQRRVKISSRYSQMQPEEFCCVWGRCVIVHFLSSISIRFRDTGLGCHILVKYLYGLCCSALSFHFQRSPLTTTLSTHTVHAEVSHRFNLRYDRWVCSMTDILKWHTVSTWPSVFIPSSIEKEEEEECYQLTFLREQGQAVEVTDGGCVRCVFHSMHEPVKTGSRACVHVWLNIQRCDEGAWGIAWQITGSAWNKPRD